MVIADTGFWLALANRRDGHHARARACLEDLHESLVTTWPVLTETCHLLLRRLGVEAELRFVRALRDHAIRIHPLTEDDLQRMGALMQSYRDLPMDLADASLVVLAEHLGHGRILTTDQRDFGAYRWKASKPFQDLMGRG